MITELTADPTAFPTDGPVTTDVTDVTDATDVTDGCAPGFWSSVAAWACLVKMNKRKKIPAAAIANCATRTVTRYASSCDIDSSHPLGWAAQAGGQNGPGSAMQDR